MKRRDALTKVSMILGGTIVGSEIFLYGCKPETKQLSNLEFTPENIAFLDEVGDTIIPSTEDSPGAKAAKIGEFMKVMVSDCYKEEEQKVFLDGIVALNQASMEATENDFMALSPDEKKSFLADMDKKAKEHQGETPHYFTMIKQLTLWGYFTSEVGATQALRYVETPGRWEACTPYEKGEKSWAL